MLKNKTAVIMGVANERSIATYVAKALEEQGCKLIFNHLPGEKMEKRVQRALGELKSPPLLVAPCDVGQDVDVDRFFSEVEKVSPKIDILLHSIAYADLDDIRGPTLNCSREGFKRAMDISAYSLIGVCKRAEKLLSPGASVLAMTYFGGEKVVPGYNMMGVVKSALDSVVRYLAFDLGPSGIRVNALSAGPIKTLAASAVGDFGKMIGLYESSSPLGRNITVEEVAKSSLYLLSDLASGVTGEIHHVDCGYNIMGGLEFSTKAKSTQ
jgi:enoyl-[acyl-carrier protein] reductase I